MTIFDTCMVNQEFDMAVCRLTELEGVRGLIHVFVEADVDHQDHPKPYHFTEALADGRFDQWKDRLRIVRATGLPTHADQPDPWAREHAQREHTATGLTDATSGDVILHGDLDEIPTAVFARCVQPSGFTVAWQRMHPFAVDWYHPNPNNDGLPWWRGTVAGRPHHITSFSVMRDARNHAQGIPASGWHFSWVGGRDYTLDKLGSFCHPEIAGRTLQGLSDDTFMAQGFHVDGNKLEPVEVDRRWPKWITDGHAPASWYRPRDVDRTDWTPPTGREILA